MIMMASFLDRESKTALSGAPKAVKLTGITYGVTWSAGAPFQGAPVMEIIRAKDRVRYCETWIMQPIVPEWDANASTKL
jgi:hypothetical protein